MLEIIFFSFSIVMERRWKQWMLIIFMVSGTCSLVSVHQPPVITTALGHDVIMPCHLNISHDEKMESPPVLYWFRSAGDTDDNKLWEPSEKYQKRVDLLDKETNTTNKSILLKNVLWSDSGKYLCKLSVTTTRSKRFRIKGTETLLMVYDTMIFNLTGHNSTLISCEVNVTRDPRFVLSISHDAYKPQTTESARGNVVPDLLYITLSKTIFLRRKGKYECQLHLNKVLMTKSIFYYHLPEPDVVVFPEPWILYTAVLLVPLATLVGLLTAMLMCRN
ncbi:uncharacterized protein LOC104930291 isoform X2 [Larimichthys crocea]|uniref:uncharacterized protein LOC104930291 isoform X2 n=1 Tax=Larimichthys crocea TaxID=215358 RepID=UPI000901BE5B|nr:uncharacterized protein LOC104930291 isoform X2 [Larimichthys crocea]